MFGVKNHTKKIPKKKPTNHSEKTKSRKKKKTKDESAKRAVCPTFWIPEWFLRKINLTKSSYFETVKKLWVAFQIPWKMIFSMGKFQGFLFQGPPFRRTTPTRTLSPRLQQRWIFSIKKSIQVVLQGGVITTLRWGSTQGIRAGTAWRGSLDLQ